MKRALLYGLLGGALIALLKLIEYKHLVHAYSTELYGGLVALIFTAVGIHLGLRWTRRKEVVVVKEVRIRESGPFVLDAAKLKELAITPREHEILGLIAQGLSNREIGEQLFVSENTVKTHSSRLFEKLGASRRVQAVKLGKELSHPLSRVNERMISALGPENHPKGCRRQRCGARTLPRQGGITMKKIVLTFGLISGVVLATMTAIMLTLCMSGAIDFDQTEVIGYTIMVLSFLMVFFAIRSYRDEVGGGVITFGRAFKVGILVALVACAVYVISWEIVYFNFIPDFVDKYAAFTIEKMKTKGATEAALAAKAAEMAEFKRLYANPLINVAFTFMEVFPVGLIVTLVSAGILRRKASLGAS